MQSPLDYLLVHYLRDLLPVVALTRGESPALLVCTVSGLGLLGRGMEWWAGSLHLRANIDIHLSEADFIQRVWEDTFVLKTDLL